MKSIMFIIHALGTGGAEVVTANYAVELKKRGYRVYLLELWSLGSYLEDFVLANGVELHYIVDNKSFFKKGFGVIKQLIDKAYLNKKIQKEINDYKCDVVHINTNLNQFVNVTFPLNCRVFYTNHSDVYRSLEMNGSVHETMLKKMIDDGMNLISISSNVYRDNNELFPNANNKLIPNGVYLSEIKENQINRRILREKYDVPEEAFVVGHIGRFNKVKNHDKLFGIFNEILKKNKNAYLVLMGTGTDEEIIHIKTLKTKSFMPERIKLLGNISNASNCIGMLDVLILPSFSESFSLVMIEAQACNVRCVASDALPDEVFCNKNTFSLSIESSDELWADIALSDSECMHNNNISSFDMDKVIIDLIDFYS